ncbi:MAG: phosphate ABC transporter substrate-binding protein PstS [Acidothermus sp.]|nr:phosphate ABC transporter substrate-binding protein PstS [Acidothermus sp.]
MRIAHLSRWGIAGAAAIMLAACSNSNASSTTGSTTPGLSSAAATALPGSAAGSVSPCVSGTLTGGGSTFQAPMQEKWISGYLARCAQARINYSSIGSGAGIQQFVAGTVDFAGSDVLMKSDEQAGADKRCNGAAVHVPVTAGGVGITWNVPGVSSLRLSPDTLADIFQGKITDWDSPEIAADNPGVRLPKLAITVFHRSDSSGTTGVFTSFLAATSKKWTLGSGKTVNWPSNTQGAKGNEGVSAGVAQTVGGITYTEQAFALQRKLPLALIENAGGHFVALDPQTVSKALASATVEPRSPHDVSVRMNYRATDPGAYPISSVTYVIVCTAYPSNVAPEKVRLLRSYLSYALTDGQQFAAAIGYAPLPTDVLQKAQASVDAIS